jgi:hypothetical protein
LPDSPVLATFTIITNKANQHFYYIFSSQDMFYNHQEKAKATILDENKRKVIVKATGETERFIENLPSFSSGAGKEKLYLYNTSFDKNFGINTGGEILKSEIRWFKSLPDKKKVMLDPVYFILSELDLDELELRSLNNIRFLD